MEVIQCLTKLVLTIYIFKCFGFLLGPVITLLALLTFKYSIKIIFGLEELSAFDKFYLGTTHKDTFEVLGLLSFETFDADLLYKIAVEKVVTKIKKLRMRVVKRMGNYYWKEVSIEEAKSRVTIINNLNINNDEELHKYLSQEVNIHINSFEELPYQVKIIPYAKPTGNTAGAVVIKFDHVVGDGLGMVSTILCTADNYDPNMFPSVMKNLKVKWYHKILDVLSLLYYGPMIIFTFMLGESKKSPFKFPPTGMTKFSISKEYNIEKFNKVKKELNLSFNDVITCCLSSTVKRIYDKFGDEFADSTKFNCFIPVGRKGVPNNINEIELGNDLFIVLAKIPLIRDVKKESHIIVKNLKQLVRSSGYFSATLSLLKIAAEYLPLNLYKLINKYVIEDVDMLFSNVPGPTTPVYYGGCKVTSIVPIISTNQVRDFFLIYSYNKTFLVKFAVDIDCRVDQNEFLKILDEEFVKLTM
jgi:NRPS condensation-like uncharacterized protein